MSYHYAEQRPRIFTEEGVAMLLETRDQAFKQIRAAGAVRMDKCFTVGDSWLSLACVDYLIETGDLREVTPATGVAGQDRVFVAAKESV